MAQNILTPVAKKNINQPQTRKKLNLSSWSFFGLVHLAAFAAFFVGWSWTALAVAFGFYFIRMFAITAFYHRYFSHRSYKTSRFAQFIFAIMGASACQQGPIWWAANHRHHHRYSDQVEDIHSPIQESFFQSHIGWIIDQQDQPTKTELVPDLMKFPELRLIDKYYIIPPFALGTFCFFLGTTLNYFFPALGTNGIQMLLWGFFFSTVALWHGTFVINSLCHIWGSRRYETKDQSRNNFWLALITLGEGWHNNHHYYHSSVRQGFFWWEIDISYYILWMMSKGGIIWDLKYTPKHKL